MVNTTKALPTRHVLYNLVKRKTHQVSRISVLVTRSGLGGWKAQGVWHTLDPSGSKITSGNRGKLTGRYRRDGEGFGPTMYSAIQYFIGGV